ncbi:MAG: hypothetical protein IJH80_01545 [Ruminococcus sp.]|nr:hypothetical protein [Ruminococcus sp.]
MDNQYRRYNKRGSMDSISTPDTDKIVNLSDPNFGKINDINSKADKIFIGDKRVRSDRFDRATKSYDDINLHTAEELEQKRREEEKDILKYAATPPKKAATGLNRGTKLGNSYVRKGTIVKWAVIFVAALLIIVLFFPPFFSSETKLSGVRLDDDPFEGMGLTDFKTYALSNYSVYSEEAFSSEDPNNYRVVDLVFSIRNPSPLEMKIPQYDIFRVPDEYKKAVCYATSWKKNSEGKVIGDTVPGFSSADVTIRVMVNVTDMTDNDFDDCVTSMIISTSGAEKKLTKTTYIPCIPAFMPVSNNIDISLTE